MPSSVERKRPAHVDSATGFEEEEFSRPQVCCPCLLPPTSSVVSCSRFGPPSQLLDLRPSKLGFLVSLCNESARLDRDGEEIIELGPKLQRVLGLEDLTFDFNGLLERMDDRKENVAVRARHVQVWR